MGEEGLDRVLDVKLQSVEINIGESDFMGARVIDVMSGLVPFRVEAILHSVKSHI